MQLPLFQSQTIKHEPHKQLLKWIGNKARFAEEIISYFPQRFGTYWEPFIGSGAVMAELAPRKAVGSDTFAPLVEIWKKLESDPDGLVEWYRERCKEAADMDKKEGYAHILKRYNTSANGADLLWLCRAAYGGVVRFRKRDGYMSTPVGAHKPIPPAAFAKRVGEWKKRLAGAHFLRRDYRESFTEAAPGDLIYCDPPYSHSQAILYGAQDFSLEALFAETEKAKARGVAVAISIDGTKKSGDTQCALPIPDGLFEQEIFIEGGRSMLKRFQMKGQSLETECVSDRLLLTY